MIKQRSSNIELLKILSMFLIVLGHTRPRDTAVWSNTYFTVGSASDSIQYFLTSIGGYLGAYGNCLFIICSAWFLIDSSKVKIDKVFKMASDVWIFSVVSLSVVLAFKITPPSSVIVKSLLPNTYGLYWFITCYAIFYMLHPALHSIVHNLSKRELLKLSLFLFFIYFILYFLVPKAVLYFTYLLGFCSIYIIFGYLKLYLQKYLNDYSLNVQVFWTFVIIMVGTLFLLNHLFVKIPALSSQLKYFSYFNNAIIFLTCLSCFNIFRLKNASWSNIRINYLASLSLLVYIIHENYFYANYCRHLYYDYVFQHFGPDNVFFFTFLHGIATFVISYLIAILYDRTLRRFWHKIVLKLSVLFINKIELIVDRIEKL